MNAHRFASSRMVAAIVAGVLTGLLGGCGANVALREHVPRVSVEEEEEGKTRDSHGARTAGETELEIDGLLAAHNRHRKAHCAPPLRWSAELERVARDWAHRLHEGGCNVLEHSQGKYGENLATGTTGAFSPEDIVAMWYQERQHYDFDRPKFSMKTGHFTQLVWSDSERMGCAVAKCTDLTVWVCNYDPPGNVRGEFERKVLPATCSFAPRSLNTSTLMVDARPSCARGAASPPSRSERAPL